MSYTPDIETFTKTYGEGISQVVWTTLVADLETPVSAMLKLADGRANTFLLWSSNRRRCFMHCMHGWRR